MALVIDTQEDLHSAIRHMDRGSQYFSKKILRILKGREIRSSMSKQGDRCDNACAGSFFHSLKVEAIHREVFTTRKSMREAVFEYIELDYNSKSLHSFTNNTDPVDCKLKHVA